MNNHDFSISQDAFMKKYKVSNNLEKEAMETPQGRITEGNWMPSNIKILSGEVHLEWIKRKSITQKPTLNTNFNYAFEEEGYVYIPKTEIEADGTKIINHFFIKEYEAPFSCGISSISINGILNSDIRVPESLKRKGMSKAIYKLILKENVKNIATNYSYTEKYTSDNYLEFMKGYSKTNDPVKAALETPQGKIIGKDWRPTKIEIYIEEKEIHIDWVKRRAKVKYKHGNVININSNKGK